MVAILQENAGLMLSMRQIQQLDSLLRELSPEQLYWVSGYINGYHVRGNSAQIAAEAEQALVFTILYATETGNALELAETFAGLLSSRGIKVRVENMADYVPRQIKSEQYLLIITSTHGEGEPPESAKTFYEFLHGRKITSLEQLKFAVLALGDSSYEFFCQTGKDFESRLSALGGQSLLPRLDCDVDYEEASATWLQKLSKQLDVVFKESASKLSIVAGGASASLAQATASSASLYTKKHPFPALLLENLCLSGRGSSKETRHLEFSLDGSGLEYEAGDALGVVPCNDSAVIERVCAELSYSGSETVSYKGETQTLHELLTNKLEITTLTPGFLKQWHEWSGAEALGAIVADPRACHVFCESRHIEDVIQQFPLSGLGVEDFVGALRALQPRLYSIASCLQACPDEVHITLGLVRYQNLGYERRGVASGYLQTSKVDSRVPVYIQENRNFRLPADTTTPVIMLGAGTGIAPYRAFLQSMDESGVKRQSWLFFGDRNFRSDFLYQLEWQNYLKAGTLSKMDVAFSRDQIGKVYIQHRLLQEARSVYDWLEQGATIYVCGDAKHMAHDVHTSLVEIVKQQRDTSTEDAEAYLKNMRQNKRYLQDVY